MENYFWCIYFEIILNKFGTVRLNLENISKEECEYYDIYGNYGLCEKYNYVYETLLNFISSGIIKVDTNYYLILKFTNRERNGTGFDFTCEFILEESSAEIYSRLTKSLLRKIMSNIDEIKKGKMDIGNKKVYSGKYKIFIDFSNVHIYFPPIADIKDEK